MMLEIILGAIFAITGSVITISYQLGNTRKRRMDEVIAEKKVIANAEAYSRIKKIQTFLSQSNLVELYEYIICCEEWFFNSRLFLPGEFPNKWLSIRNGTKKAIDLKKRSKKSSKELSQLENTLSKLAGEAGTEIYKEMRLKTIKIDSSIL